MKCRRQGETDEEIDNRGNGPVGENLYKGVNLVFFPDGTDFQKGETRMHGKNHDCTQHKKQHIGTVLETCHH